MRLLLTTLCALLAALPCANAQSTGQTVSKAVLVTGQDIVESTVRKQIEQLVQLNEGQPHTYERAALIKMLDEALSTARPRS